MKSTILIILILISINGYAQIHSIGIQGGLNITNLKADNSFMNIEFLFGQKPDTFSSTLGGSFDGNKFKTGLIGGINYEVLFPNKFTIGADLLYSQRGFNGKVDFTNSKGEGLGTFDTKFIYNYLSLPLKFGYSTGHVFVKIGLCPSYLLKFKMTQPIFYQNGNYIFEAVEIKEKVSKFDISGLVEFGGCYELNNTLELFSSIIYRNSFTSFSNSDYYSNTNMRHYGFSLSIGLKYLFNKEYN
jgi:hypothetical protein